VNLFAADLRAFVAAGRKELRQQRRYPTLFLGQLFWPVVLPASWVLMGQAYSGNDPQAVAAFAERAGSSNVAVFVFVGYAMYNWLSTLLWGAGTALRQEQLRGSLEAVFVTPASRLVPLFGPGVGTLLPMAVVFASNFLALRIFFGISPPAGAVIQAAVIVVLGIPALYAIGALFAASVLRFGEVGPVVQLIRGMFVLACGITFPVAMLPLWAQLWAKLMPPTYIVDDIRRILLRGDTLADVGGDIALVLGLAALTAILAMAVFRYMETSARRSGMLGQF
jgi:ABC-2 type transport system permease protein